MFLSVEGGDEIQRECHDYIRQHRVLTTGEVMSSGPGRLPFKKIIHAVGPRWTTKAHEAKHVRDLETCIENCLDKMIELGLTSIAIPPISTGIFGFPLKLAVETIVKTVSRLDKEMDLPGKIIFIDNKTDSLRLFEQELSALTRSVKIPSQPRKTTKRPGKSIYIRVF